MLGTPRYGTGERGVRLLHFPLLAARVRREQEVAGNEGVAGFLAVSRTKVHLTPAVVCFSLPDGGEGEGMSMACESPWLVRGLSLICRSLV